MSHRPAPPPPAFHSNRMEPLILMSGFLTKRTKTMSRWKKRWWQLLGDGSLLYFKGEARVYNVHACVQNVYTPIRVQSSAPVDNKQEYIIISLTNSNRLVYQIPPAFSE